jgi:prolyl oligopeptidase PreP (S9A serine peptidase family)
MVQTPFMLDSIIIQNPNLFDLLETKSILVGWYWTSEFFDVVCFD